MLKTTIIASLAAAAFLSLPALAEDKTTLQLCTGGKSGVYYAKGKGMEKAAHGTELKIETLSTRGSWYNIQEVAKDDGVCQAAIVQADAYALLAKRNKAALASIDRIGSLHYEYVHLICNASYGKGDETILESGKAGSKKIAIGKQGSGPWVTWNNIIAEDDDYDKVTKPVFLGGSLAASKVADGADADCLLYVAGLGSGYLHKLDTRFGKDLVMRDFDDKDFDDAVDPKGTKLYEFADIPRTFPRGLQKPYWGANNSIRMRAIVVVRTAWVSDHEDEFEILIDAMASVR